MDNLKLSNLYKSCEDILGVCSGKKIKEIPDFISRSMEEKDKKKEV